MVGCGPSRYALKLKDLDLSATHVAMRLNGIQLSTFKSRIHIAIRLVGRKAYGPPGPTTHFWKLFAVKRLSYALSNLIARLDNGLLLGRSPPHRGSHDNRAHAPSTTTRDRHGNAKFRRDIVHGKAADFDFVGQRQLTQKTSSFSTLSLARPVSNADYFVSKCVTG